jgi:hypothetical protein
MRKFKELVKAIYEATGAASKAAALRFTRSREPAPIDTGRKVYPSGFPEDPLKPGQPYDNQTYLDRTALISGAKDVRNRRKAAAAQEGAAEGEAKQKRIAIQTKRMRTTEKAAKTLGIPDIDAILKAGDVAGVTVVGHENNGYIAMHQGVKHFRHPNGKTHANVELQASPNGIGVWASRVGKKSTKAIAYLHPKGDALPVSGNVKSGKITVDAEDDLNKR